MPRLFTPPAAVTAEVGGPFGPFLNAEEQSEYDAYLDAVEESRALAGEPVGCVLCGHRGKLLDGLCGDCFDRHREELECEPCLDLDCDLWDGGAY